MRATVCWGSMRNSDCILYPGAGTVVLIRPAQTFYERIRVVQSFLSWIAPHSVPSSHTPKDRRTSAPHRTLGGSRRLRRPGGRRPSASGNVRGLAGPWESRRRSCSRKVPRNFHGAVPQRRAQWLNRPDRTQCAISAASSPRRGEPAQGGPVRLGGRTGKP